VLIVSSPLSTASSPTLPSPASPLHHTHSPISSSMSLIPEVPDRGFLGRHPHAQIRALRESLPAVTFDMSTCTFAYETSPRPEEKRAAVKAYTDFVKDLKATGAVPRCCVCNKNVDIDGPGPSYNISLCCGACTHPKCLIDYHADGKRGDCPGCKNGGTFATL